MKAHSKHRTKPKVVSYCLIQSQYFSITPYLKLPMRELILSYCCLKFHKYIKHRTCNRVSSLSHMKYLSDVSQNSSESYLDNYFILDAMIGRCYLRLLMPLMISRSINSFKIKIELKIEYYQVSYLRVFQYRKNNMQRNTFKTNRKLTKSLLYVALNFLRFYYHVTNRVRESILICYIAEISEVNRNLVTKKGYCYFLIHISLLQFL